MDKRLQLYEDIAEIKADINLIKEHIEPLVTKHENYFSRIFGGLTLCGWITAGISFVYVILNITHLL